MVTTENADYLEPGTRVDLFDGRASKEETIRMIKKVGAKNVRIFNSYGDWPGANEPMSTLIAALVDATDSNPYNLSSLIKQKLGGIPSVAIANLDVTKKIKRQYPDVEVYLLERIA